MGKGGPSSSSTPTSVVQPPLELPPQLKALQDVLSKQAIWQANSNMPWSGYRAVDLMPNRPPQGLQAPPGGWIPPWQQHPGNPGPGVPVPGRADMGGINRPAGLARQGWPGNPQQQAANGMGAGLSGGGKGMPMGGSLPHPYIPDAQLLGGDMLGPAQRGRPPGGGPGGL